MTSSLGRYSSYEIRREKSQYMDHFDVSRVVTI